MNRWMRNCWGRSFNPTALLRRCPPAHAGKTGPEPERFAWRPPFIDASRAPVRQGSRRSRDAPSFLGVYVSEETLQITVKLLFSLRVNR